jgi:DNA polymerase III sliding clamp (beta) subunit (PCNA family)
MKTNFKLHLATSKDKIRPVLTKILVTRNEIVATDAHILAMIPVSTIFDLASIELIPEDGILIDSQVWKAVYNAESLHLIQRDGIYLTAYFKNKPALEYRTETNGTGERYPDYKRVIPDHEHAQQQTDVMKLNPKLLENLRQALDATAGVKMEFNGHNKGINITPVLERGNEDKTAEHGTGLIMPMMI